MGIITKEVFAKPNRRYLSLGYKIFTKKGKGHGCKCSDVLGKNTIFDFDKYIKVKIEDLPKHSIIPLQVECDNCHKIFSTDKDHLARKKEFNKTGVWYCNNCAKSIYLSGERNYRWDKDRTWEQRNKDRATPQYLQLKRNALFRDNFKCQICNSKAEVVHHLDSANLFPEKMYEITNVVSLCNKCHADFHSKYGYGNNIKSQFEEWANKIFEFSNIEDYDFSSARKVYCFETDKIYHSTTSCEIEFNFKHGSVYTCCAMLRNQDQHKGFHFVFYDEIQGMNESEIAEYYANKLDSHKDRIKCFIDLQTGIIYETRSLCNKVNHLGYRLYNKNFDENSYKTERFIPYSLYNELKRKNILCIDNISFYIDRRI